MVPCGSGGEAGIAIVAPQRSRAHDECVMTLGRVESKSSISAEILPFVAGTDALTTVEATSPTTRRQAENLVIDSKQLAGRLGSMAFGAV